MIRIACHIQRSRHGIWFFRVVVPKNLRRALDGRGEIKKSLGTRDSREALRVARPLAFAAKELFARLEASLSRPPTVAEVLANAANARELKTTNTVDLGGGRSLSYSLETSSNDPAEIAAFHAEAARLQAKQDEQIARYQEKPVAVPEAMLEYQRREQEEMARFKAGLAADAAKREIARPDGEGEEDAPAFKPDPENVVSARWAEYVAQRKGNNWSALRTASAFEGMFAEFQQWWGQDVDVRFITRKVVNKFIVYLQKERPIMSGARKGLRGLNVRTVDNYTTVLNGFLEWAQEKGYFPDSRRLPTAGQAIVKKAARNRRKDKANPRLHAVAAGEALRPSALRIRFGASLLAAFDSAFFRSAPAGDRPASRGRLPRRRRDPSIRHRHLGRRRQEREDRGGQASDPCASRADRDRAPGLRGGRPSAGPRARALPRDRNQPAQGEGQRHRQRMAAAPREAGHGRRERADLPLFQVLRPQSAKSQRRAVRDALPTRRP
jgi:hypothetical protein